eukprot:TRINITY_DN16970_c0_g1_i1.p1 TRINITY_DN16970_c0_g1~~TRINITY_DN16970_c0_g1_i1.p1  ORF type:complete len:241 (+),score=46.63 TRINITY_DN16970_c0_g1_i1:47-724(+)
MCIRDRPHSVLQSFFFFKQKTAYEIMPSLVGSEMCIRDRHGDNKPSILKFVLLATQFSSMLSSMPTPIRVPGKECVWDYPRPPKLEPVTKRIRILFNNETVADSTGAYRVCETSHPPTYYIPRTDFNQEYVKKAAGSSFCEWKGQATYWSIQVGDKLAQKCAWSYEDPTPGFLPIKGMLAVYAGMMDACFVEEEKVVPQPGGFYGGWITSDITGPFKGEPGTYGW